MKTKTKVPRVKLSEKLRAAHLEGYSEGFRQAQADFQHKLKVQAADLDKQRLEAKIKLVVAAGQAYDAISRALHDDSVAGRGFDK